MLACLVIPGYAAQVEQLSAPTRAPLLLVAGTHPRVMALDAQAGRCGARRGMPLKRAQALCPDAEIRPLVESRLRTQFESVLDIVNGFASRCEVQPPAGGADPVLWLDLGTAADIAALAAQLRKTLRDLLSLHADSGVAPGKFPAFAAALSGGVTIIPPGHERAFLAPLPVSLLPLTADETRRLELYGLHTLGLLAALPRAALFAQFGPRGRLLHQLACGEDPRPLNPYQPPPVERINRRFSDPLADEEQLDHVLRELAAEAAASLGAKGAACGRLTLCLGYERGSAQEQSHTLREPLTAERDLLRALHRLCAALPHAEVVAVEAELSVLTAEQPRQLSLFTAPSTKRRTPHQAARTHQARHPEAAFVRAIVPEQAELMPESVAFASLWEDI